LLIPRIADNRKDINFAAIGNRHRNAPGTTVPGVSIAAIERRLRV